MLAWFKNIFKKADDKLDEFVFTPFRMKVLIEDFFALLRAGVVVTPSPVDNVLLEQLEQKLDKDLLAGILASRLRDLM